MGIGDVLGNLLHQTTQQVSKITTSTTGGTMSVPVSRAQEPLLDLAGKIGPVIGLATAAVSVATNLGVLNQKSSGFLSKGLSGAQVILGLIPAVIAGFGAHTAAQVVARQGRELVSPLGNL